MNTKSLMDLLYTWLKANLLEVQELEHHNHQLKRQALEEQVELKQQEPELVLELPDLEQLELGLNQTHLLEWEEWVVWECNTPL